MEGNWLEILLEWEDDGRPIQNRGLPQGNGQKNDKNDVVSILFVDFGTMVRLKDMRLLHKRFLDMPAQAILARMLGVKEIVGEGDDS